MFDAKSFSPMLPQAIWLLAATITISGGCQFASQGMNVEGARLHRQGNYQGAIQRFMQSIANDPSNPNGYYNLAATYHRMGKQTGRESDYLQAENFYNQCLDRAGDHTACYRGLAVLLAETNRSDAAFRLLEGWENRSPTLPDPKIELARLMEEYSDPSGAREHLIDALALEPNNPRALTALGKLREASGDHLQALADYERSLQVNRFQPEVAMRVAALQSIRGTSTIRSEPGQPRLVREGLMVNHY